MIDLLIFVCWPVQRVLPTCNQSKDIRQGVRAWYIKHLNRNDCNTKIMVSLYAQRNKPERTSRSARATWKITDIPVDKNRFTFELDENLVEDTTFFRLRALFALLVYTVQSKLKTLLSNKNNNNNL